ncbi:hypothetical protein MIND_01132700 [Mycena indigotica]|uniref:Uncharacterized protein n=1 Tax=Mycena indigotica TaxID=2126181 RepID=A0A8H6S760_9AGAR|nr:uncharacterized protein MIND_01132700 [Mycena indigotica]KAF7293543.1 hypothetical protein MIND_01132700 [Mycena indigotica]
MSALDETTPAGASDGHDPRIGGQQQAQRATPSHSTPQGVPEDSIRLSGNRCIALPKTPTEAETAIHFLCAQRHRCVTEYVAAQRRIHEQITYLDLLRAQVDRIVQEVLEAESDIGRTRDAISAKGLPVSYIVFGSAKRTGDSGAKSNAALPLLSSCEMLSFINEDFGSSIKPINYLVPTNGQELGLPVCQCSSVCCSSVVLKSLSLETNRSVLDLSYHPITLSMSTNSSAESTPQTSVSSRSVTVQSSSPVAPTEEAFEHDYREMTDPFRLTAAQREDFVRKAKNHDRVLAYCERVEDEKKALNDKLTNYQRMSAHYDVVREELESLQVSREELAENGRVLRQDMAELHAICSEQKGKIFELENTLSGVVEKRELAFHLLATTHRDLAKARRQATKEQSRLIEAELALTTARSHIRRLVQRIKTLLGHVDTVFESSSETAGVAQSDVDPSSDDLADVSMRG